MNCVLRTMHAIGREQPLWRFKLWFQVFASAAAPRLSSLGGSISCSAALLIRFETMVC
jgi:hypothetical protein